MTAVSMDERQGRGTRWAVALATFLVFAIAGPLIGGGLLLAALIGLDSVPPGFVGYSLNAYVFATGTVLLPYGSRSSMRGRARATYRESSLSRKAFHFAYSVVSKILARSRG